MAVVLDSDAVIGFLDDEDALHRDATSAIRRHIGARERLLCSVVTFAEVLTGALRSRHPEEPVRGSSEISYPG